MKKLGRGERISETQNTSGSHGTHHIRGISDINNITSISDLSLRFRRGVEDKDLAALQGRVCRWFEARGWLCSYVRFDDVGRLDFFQSGQREYCEWGHYLGSGPYDWHARTPLTRVYDRKAGRGRLFFPSGRETQRFSSYSAVIAMPTRHELQWNPARARYTPAWNGSPPQLWWHRERCDRARYERRRAMYETKHDLRAETVLAFTLSKHIPDADAAKIKVPEGFLAAARETLKEFSELVASDPTHKRRAGGPTNN